MFGDVPLYNVMWHELALLNADKENSRFLQMMLGNLIFLRGNDQSQCLFSEKRKKRMHRKS